MGKMSQAVKRQENGLPINDFQGGLQGGKKKQKEKAFISGHAVYSEYNIPSVSCGARMQMNTQ